MLERIELFVFICRNIEESEESSGQDQILVDGDFTSIQSQFNFSLPSDIFLGLLIIWVYFNNQLLMCLLYIYFIITLSFRKSLVLAWTCFKYLCALSFSRFANKTPKSAIRLWLYRPATNLPHPCQVLCWWLLWSCSWAEFNPASRWKTFDSHCDIA